MDTVELVGIINILLDYGDTNSTARSREYRFHDTIEKSPISKVRLVLGEAENRVKNTARSREIMLSPAILYL